MSDQKIVGFHRDDDDHWVAELGGGPSQHVRHTPPWQYRPWVVTQSGRDGQLGNVLDCVKCDRREPADGNWCIREA